MPGHLLLLTATIRPPPGVPALRRIDPQQRLLDYGQALDFYSSLIGSTFDSIVFTENSESDLGSLRRQVEKAGRADRVEFLSFAGLDYPPRYGRGYGEFRIVEHAVENSRLLSAAGDDAIVWKCTGRYVVRNMASLVKSRPRCDLYCHMRDYAYRLCELYLLSWTRRGYDHAIKGVYPRLRNDVVPGEHTIEEKLYRRVVDERRSRLDVVPRFKEVPLVQGVRGWNNQSYSDLPWQPKVLLRRAANVVAPWLWI